MLTEAGWHVVALEKGPWRTKETFGGDELANVNRYNLWPDPLLNPRTVRDRADEQASVELFCPVPQMVGGGTVHWQGWLPRFTPEDFRLRSIAGDVPGATLADWPISYDELEPYYTKVEWAFGVSGQAGANAFEGPRSQGYPCPPMPQSRYAEKFHKGAPSWAGTPSRPRRPRCPGPFNGRPATVISAFAQQHGDPTGTRSSALNVFIPHALATGRYDLRPESYVRELRVDAGGRVRAAVYEDADGDMVEQEADVVRPGLRRGRDRPAAADVEVRPLPERPRQRQRPGRSQRHLPRVQRRRSGRSTTRSTPGPAAATSAPARSSSTTTTTRRGFVSGGHIAAAGVGIPLPINWRLPGRPTWGAEAKQIDREFFNHSMAVAMVLHDMPQHDNRVDLDDKGRRRLGSARRPDHPDPHENDLTRGAS